MEMWKNGRIGEWLNSNPWPYRLYKGGGGGWGGGGQPYLHFSVEKTLGIGLSTEIELVSCDLFPLPCLTMLFVWVLTTNLLQNEALC